MALQCAFSLVLVNVTAWIWIRLRRPTRGELAICGKSSESSNAIARDGLVVEPEPAPRRRERVPRQACGGLLASLPWARECLPRGVIASERQPR